MKLTSQFVEFSEYLQAMKGLEPAGLYHESCWEQAVVEGFKLQSRGLITRDEDGIVMAATPVFFRRRFGMLIGGSPLRGMYTEFAGPCFSARVDGPVRSAIVAQQHKHLRQSGCVYVEWGVRGGRDDLEPEEFSAIRSRNIVYSRRPTLVLDLAMGREAAWNRFEGRARNMVRKAEKSGVKVAIEPFRDELLISFTEMVGATFKAKGLALPHPPGIYGAIGRHLEPLGFSKFLAARVEGSLVAGGLFLLHRERMVYLSGSSTPEGNRLAANSLVQWAAINEAITSGVSLYDLGGVGIDSIDSFKASFGGEPAHHHRWVHASRIVRIGASCLERLAKRGFFSNH